MRGLYSHSREKLFSEYLAKFLVGFILVRIHAAPVFAPALTQEQSWRSIDILVLSQGVSMGTVPGLGGLQKCCLGILLGFISGISSGGKTKITSAKLPKKSGAVLGLSCLHD